MYIYHNKKIDEYYAFSNLRALCDAAGINENKLYNIFSRKKLLRYDCDDYVVIKCK